MLVGYRIQRKRLGPRRRKLDGEKGFDFVRCRICGDHRRVISGRHLSKHDIDREAYMEEYHLTPDELIAKAFRVIQSSRRGYYPNGRSEWIETVKKVYKRDGKIFARYLQDKYKHLYEQGIWIFGDWDKALRAAGFDPKKMRRRRLWDHEKIISEIRAMREQNLPLFAKYAMENHAEVFKAALRQFGSWPKALLATGVTKKPRTKKIYRGRTSLLNALSDALEVQGIENMPQALKVEAAHYFGSLEKAIAALKEQRNRLSGWNRQKIIAALSRMHRSKESLNYVKARSEHMALVSAAEAYFGRWGKALYAAGIDPNEYFVRRAWHQRKK